MEGDRIVSPFHTGELRAQQLAGAAPAAAAIRARMPDQHRTFFPLLRFLCVAAADADGWPLATLVQGAPGFASAPDAARLQVGALPADGDPVRVHLAIGAPVGLLGIDLATRRRNRLNGVIAQAGPDGFAVDVVQSFGNCPRYIQVRELVPVARSAGPVTAFGTALPERARRMLAASGTLFVASTSGTSGTSGTGGTSGISAQGSAAGLDISHRGGPPGFARLDGEVLTVPDYAGNRYFNTLGNFMADPRAAMVLADFSNGDLLQLQGEVEIDWSAADPGQVPPAERAWRFRIVRGRLSEGAFSLAEGAASTTASAAPAAHPA